MSTNEEFKDMFERLLDEATFEEGGVQTANLARHINRDLTAFARMVKTQSPDATRITANRLRIGLRLTPQDFDSRVAVYMARLYVATIYDELRIENPVRQHLLDFEDARQMDALLFHSGRSQSLERKFACISSHFEIVRRLQKS